MEGFKNNTGSEVSCPFCAETDLIRIEQDVIDRQARMRTVVNCEARYFHYIFRKYLCTKCGAVFERLDKEALDRMKAERSEWSK